MAKHKTNKRAQTRSSVPSPSDDCMYMYAQRQPKLHCLSPAPNTNQPPRRSYLIYHYVPRPDQTAIRTRLLAGLAVYIYATTTTTTTSHHHISTQKHQSDACAYILCAPPRSLRHVLRSYPREHPPSTNEQGKPSRDRPTDNYHVLLKALARDD